MRGVNIGDSISQLKGVASTWPKPAVDGRNRVRFGGKPRWSESGSFWWEREGGVGFVLEKTAEPSMAPFWKTEKANLGLVLQRFYSHRTRFVGEVSKRSGAAHSLVPTVPRGNAVFDALRRDSGRGAARTAFPRRTVGTRFSVCHAWENRCRAGVGGIGFVLEKQEQGSGFVLGNGQRRRWLRSGNARRRNLASCPDQRRWSLGSFWNRWRAVDGGLRDLDLRARFLHG